jgi:cytochrome c553
MTYPLRLSPSLKHRLLGLFTLFLSVLLSALLGAFISAADASEPYGMVDPVDARYAAGYSTYLERCATCHVALPAAVLPTQTWQALVSDPAHYGVSLPPLDRFDQQLISNYLQVYSRRHTDDGPVPYRLQDSAYFLALHPQVTLPQPLNLASCAGCHTGAANQNYSLR